MRNLALALTLFAAPALAAAPHRVPVPEHFTFVWDDLVPVTRTDAPTVLYLVKTVRIAPEVSGGLGGAAVMIHNREAHIGEVQFLAFKCADHTFSVDIEGKVANAGPGKFAVVSLRSTKGRDAELTPTSEFPSIAAVETYACTGKLPTASK